MAVVFSPRHWPSKAPSVLGALLFTLVVASPNIGAASEESQPAPADETEPSPEGKDASEEVDAKSPLDFLGEDSKRVSTDRALLLWGPSSTRDDGGLAAQALADRLDPSVPMPARSLKLSDWLGAARFRIGGSGAMISCELVPSEIPEDLPKEGALDELIRQGKTALDDLEGERALALFQLAERMVPCERQFVARDTFHAIFYYGGIAAFFSGQPDEAARMFRQSATINPGYAWSPAYGPEPQSTFLSAVQDVIARPRVRVYGDMRDTNYLDVRLDGVELDRTKAFETTVHPGTHLIQAVDEDGGWSTFIRKLDEGGSITFFSAAGAERMVLEGPNSVLATFSGARLGKRAREEQLDEIYVAVVDPSRQYPDQLFLWVSSTQQWSELDLLSDSSSVGSKEESTASSNLVAPAPELTKAEKRKKAMLRDADYRTSTTFGFKYTSMFLCSEDELTDGRCSDGRERRSDYLGGVVGVDIRLIKGLNIDLRFGAGFTDRADGGTILPEVGAGVRYRFLTGTLQPFIGVQGAVFIGTTRPDLNSNDKVVAYGGIIGNGGLDIEFEDGFRLTFEGGGGIVLSGEGEQKRWPVVHGHFALGRFLP